jgi:hypothetical protein
MDVGGRVILPGQLQAQIEAAGIPLPGGLTIWGPPVPLDPMHLPSTDISTPLPAGTLLYTQDENGVPIDLPPEAVPIVNAYTYEPPS